MRAAVALIGIHLLWSLNILILSAQEGDLPAPDVTVCDLGRAPEKYANSLISVRGWVIDAKELRITERFASGECADEIVVVFPENVRPKAGFVLQRDAAFKRLQ